jgi:hypothetical protein
MGRDDGGDGERKAEKKYISRDYGRSEGAQRFRSWTTTVHQQQACVEGDVRLEMPATPRDWVASWA